MRPRAVQAFTKQCPNTKVVLAGYSQGAMVIHRNLQDLADDPHVAAALLIADGDRLPVDTTIKMGSAVVPTPARVSPRSIRSWRRRPLRCCRPRSVPGPSAFATSGIRSATTTPSRSDVSPAALAVHTSYAPAASGSHAWGTPLYELVMRSSAASTSGVELTAHGASA